MERLSGCLFRKSKISTAGKLAVNIKRSMMKCMFILTICLVICSFNTLMAQKPVEFDYPEDSVTAESKKAFTKTFSQGKALYTITCGGCHNFKEKNKDVVPDFSMPQLMDYEMRIQYIPHREKLDDRHITDEEMNKVIMFLRFKKKSGREFPVRNVPAQ